MLFRSLILLLSLSFNRCYSATTLKLPLSTQKGERHTLEPVFGLSFLGYCRKMAAQHGGVVGGTYYDAAGVQQLASIPSRDVLISKLLGSLQSPITNMARVLKQIAEQSEQPA